MAANSSSDRCKPVRLVMCLLSVEELSETEIDDRYRFVSWRPGIFRIVPPGLSFKLAFWWLAHYLRVFRNRDYSVLYIMDGDIIAHHLVVVPSYYRWPLMGNSDVQISSTHTYPKYRRRGLATAGLRKAIALMKKPGRRFWYVSSEKNAPSIALCKTAGFKTVAYLRRINRRGLRLTHYVVDETSE